MGRIYFTFKKSFLREQGITKEDIEKGLAILARDLRKTFKELRKSYYREEEEENKNIAKAFSLAEIKLNKAFAPGTIRIWKGKKFIKGADKKWRPYNQKTDKKKIVVNKENLKKPELDAIEIDEIPENFKTMRVKELYSGKILVFTPEEGGKGRVEGWKEGESYSSVSMQLDTLKESTSYKILTVDTGNGERAVFKKYKELENEVTQKEIDRYRIETSFSLNHDFKFIKQELEKKGVVYNPVKKLKKIPSDEEIIKSLANYDGTKGSCASQALCYAAQKWGYDVTDFRGGWSRVIFAMFMQDVIQYFSAEGYTPIETDQEEAALKLLKQVREGEDNKQFLLFTGQHCAAVRKNYDGELQYLELQAGDDDKGWKYFDDTPKEKQDNSTLDENGFSEKFKEGLRRRFGITKDETKSALISIDAGIIKRSKERNDFLRLMGYINSKGGPQRTLTKEEWDAMNKPLK